ncbi:MAG: hypothetical protein AAF639_26870 [Chloroflexota bacterium]
MIKVIRRLLLFTVSIICAIVIALGLVWFTIEADKGLFNQWQSLGTPPDGAIKIVGTDFWGPWTPILYIENTKGDIYVCCSSGSNLWTKTTHSSIRNWQYNRPIKDDTEIRTMDRAVDHQRLLRVGEISSTELHFVVRGDGSVWQWRRDSQFRLLMYITLFCLWPFVAVGSGILIYDFMRKAFLQR